MKYISIEIAWNRMILYRIEKNRSNIVLPFNILLSNTMEQNRKFDMFNSIILNYISLHQTKLGQIKLNETRLEQIVLKEN